MHTVIWVLLIEETHAGAKPERSSSLLLFLPWLQFPSSLPRAPAPTRALHKPAQRTNPEETRGIRKPCVIVCWFCELNWCSKGLGELQSGSCDIAARW